MFAVPALVTLSNCWPYSTAVHKSDKPPSDAHTTLSHNEHQHKQRLAAQAHAYTGMSAAAAQLAAMPAQEPAAGIWLMPQR